MSTVTAVTTTEEIPEKQVRISSGSDGSHAGMMDIATPPPSTTPRSVGLSSTDSLSLSSTNAAQAQSLLSVITKKKSPGVVSSGQQRTEEGGDGALLSGEHDDDYYNEQLACMPAKSSSTDSTDSNTCEQSGTTTTNEHHHHNVGDEVIYNWSGIKRIGAVRQIVKIASVEQLSALLRERYQQEEALVQQEEKEKEKKELEQEEEQEDSKNNNKKKKGLRLPTTQLRVIGSGMSYEPISSVAPPLTQAPPTTTTTTDEAGSGGGDDNSSKSNESSHSLIVDLAALSGLYAINDTTATFGPATSANDVFRILAQHGRMSDASPGVIGLQTLAGAVSTGTHGQGYYQSCYADTLVSAEVVLPNGRVVTIREEPFRAKKRAEAAAAAAAAAATQQQQQQQGNNEDAKKQEEAWGGATTSSVPAAATTDAANDEEDDIPPLGAVATSLGTLGVMTKLELTHSPRRVFVCRKMQCSYETFTAEYEAWNNTFEFVKAWWFPMTGKVHVWFVVEASAEEKAHFEAHSDGGSHPVDVDMETETSLNDTVDHYLRALEHDTGVTLADSQTHQHSLTLHRFSNAKDCIGYLEQLVCKGIPVPQINSEIAVPMSKWLDATRTLRDWGQQDGNRDKLHYPFIYRATAPSDQARMYCSYGRPEGVVWIGCLVYLAADGRVRGDGMSTMDEIQQLLASKGCGLGLPHLGKHLTPEVYDFSEGNYPGATEVAVWRRRLDPHGILLNRFLARIFNRIEACNDEIVKVQEQREKAAEKGGEAEK